MWGFNLLILETPPENTCETELGARLSDTKGQMVLLLLVNMLLLIANGLSES